MIDISSLTFDPRSKQSFPRVLNKLPENIQAAVLNLLIEKCDKRAGVFAVTLCEKIDWLLIQHRAIERGALEQAICECLKEKNAHFDSRYYYRNSFLPSLEKRIKGPQKKKTVTRIRNGG